MKLLLRSVCWKNWQPTAPRHPDQIQHIYSILTWSLILQTSEHKPNFQRPNHLDVLLHIGRLKDSQNRLSAVVIYYCQFNAKKIWTHSAHFFKNPCLCCCINTAENLWPPDFGSLYVCVHTAHAHAYITKVKPNNLRICRTCRQASEAPFWFSCIKTAFMHYYITFSPKENLTIDLAVSHGLGIIVEQQTLRMYPQLNGE